MEGEEGRLTRRRHGVHPVVIGVLLAVGVVEGKLVQLVLRVQVGLELSAAVAGDEPLGEEGEVSLAEK